MIFDSHAHLISDDLVRYPPAPPESLAAPADLQRPLTAERLLEEMERNRVQRAVLVQRASIYGFDNSYVCDAAARHPDRFRAVCSIDAAVPRASGQVEHWVRARGAAGIRLMEPRRGADLSWLSGETALDAWGRAAELRIPVGVHVFRWNRLGGLAALRGILARWPRITVVIDHLSNLSAESGPPDYGIDDALRAVMSFERVYLKCTTIPLGQLDRDGIDAAPLLARVVQCFGAERVMWGSDITQSKGAYAHMVDLAERATALLSGAQREQLLYHTADAVYGRAGESRT